MDKKTFRLCGAELLSEDRAQERTEELMSWAVQHFYSPKLDWKVRWEGFRSRWFGGRVSEQWKDVEVKGFTKLKDLCSLWCDWI